MNGAELLIKTAEASSQSILEFDSVSGSFNIIKTGEPTCVSSGSCSTNLCCDGLYCDSVCKSCQSVENTCTGGLDEDCDGKADCDDPACVDECSESCVVEMMNTIFRWMQGKVTISSLIQKYIWWKEGC